MHSFGFPQLLQDLCHAKRERERERDRSSLLSCSEHRGPSRTGRRGTHRSRKSNRVSPLNTTPFGFSTKTHITGHCAAPLGTPFLLFQTERRRCASARFLSQQVDQPWEANQSEDLPIGPRTRNRPSRHTQSLLRPQKPRSLCSLWVVNPRSQS